MAFASSMHARMKPELTPLLRLVEPAATIHTMKWRHVIAMGLGSSQVEGHVHRAQRTCGHYCNNRGSTRSRPLSLLFFAFEICRLRIFPVITGNSHDCGWHTIIAFVLIQDLPRDHNSHGCGWHTC